MEKGKQTSRLYEQFSRAVMDRLRTGFAAGLSKEQVDWAWAVFWKHILVEAFFSGEPQDERSAESQAEIIASDILAEWKSLDGRRKWVWILRKAYGSRLLPLSRAAFAYARARHDGSAPREELARRAWGIQSELEKVAADMRQHAPAIRADLGGMISEIMLDCLVARGLAGGLSLRLRHVAHPGAAHKPGK
jgi:hypothetical protein